MKTPYHILVTGGAGFIGSALVRLLVSETGYHILNLDKLTYAGNLSSLRDVEDCSRYRFVQGDIADSACLRRVFEDFQPDAVMNLAAESHVDRSIDGSAEFITTNICGTHALLEASRNYYDGLSEERRQCFRFLHVSTDEVFGSLGATGLFTETTPYDPRSPYSASKAAGDHLVRAWHHTYGLPVLLTNCSNNYGPFHFPEKLIPLTILNALEGRELPVYGTGENVRDWLYVDDHARALLAVLEKGIPGKSYNIGGGNERRNIDIVHAICAILDELAPMPDGCSHAGLIRFVTDRPGHDFRYAIDSSFIRKELDWKPLETFETGIRKTVEWYLANKWWWHPIRSAKYDGHRLGRAESTKVS